MTYSKTELVNYRILRAKEAYKDGLLLAKESRWNAAANRLYYACFYIVSAYLVANGIKATTHTGLKSAFNQELIKSGKLIFLKAYFTINSFRSDNKSTMKISLI